MGVQPIQLFIKRSHIPQQQYMQWPSNNPLTLGQLLLHPFLCPLIHQPLYVHSFIQLFRYHLPCIHTCTYMSICEPGYFVFLIAAWKTPAICKLSALVRWSLGRLTRSPWHAAMRLISHWMTHSSRFCLLMDRTWNVKWAYGDKIIILLKTDISLNT